MKDEKRKETSDERRKKIDRRVASRDEFLNTDRRIGSRREEEQRRVE